ncbi:Uncharacterised protein [Acinetobacter baumannii]|nr:Uncharacterised protein [Acinetobacter baumannii]
MRAGQIVGHHARGQAEGGVVGAAHHFLFVLVAKDAHHRPEDLLAHDFHIVTAVAEHRRRHISALAEFAMGDAFAAAQQARAAVFAALDKAQHRFHVREADQRPEVGLRIGRVTDANALYALEDFRLKLRLQRRRHEDAGAVGAHLAGTVEVGHHGDIGGAIQIGVVEDNQRRFAAQLHGDVLQRRTRRVGHHLLAGFHPAGEGHFGDARMVGQVLPHFRPAAGHHVEHAVRQAGFGVDFRQLQRRQ